MHHDNTSSFHVPIKGTRTYVCTQNKQQKDKTNNTLQNSHISKKEMLHIIVIAMHEEVVAKCVMGYIIYVVICLFFYFYERASFSHART